MKELKVGMMTKLNKFEMAAQVNFGGPWENICTLRQYLLLLLLLLT